MGKTELARMKSIDRQLAKAKKRYRKVAHTHSQIDSERKAVARQIDTLQAERDALAQGQLMFPIRRAD